MSVRPSGAPPFAEDVEVEARAVRSTLIAGHVASGLFPLSTGSGDCSPCSRSGRQIVVVRLAAHRSRCGISSRIPDLVRAVLQECSVSGTRRTEQHTDEETSKGSARANIEVLSQGICATVAGHMLTRISGATGRLAPPPDPCLEYQLGKEFAAFLFRDATRRPLLIQPRKIRIGEAPARLLTDQAVGGLLRRHG